MNLHVTRRKVSGGPSLKREKGRRRRLQEGKQKPVKASITQEGTRPIT